MRLEQNLQAINAITQENFNPELLEKYSGYGGIGRELAESIGSLLKFIYSIQGRKLPF